MKILHISDLHLDNFEGEYEFLRKGFYQDYIDKLYTSIDNEYSDFLFDCLIVTGDFVDRGKTENFEHVKTIIDYLIMVFNVNSNSVFTCIGNHDYKWKDLDQITDREINDEIKLKKEYTDFRNYYNETYEANENHYSISKVRDNTYFISLDSTWKSISGTPGQLGVSEIDQLIMDLKKICTTETSLLIGCHYPIISLHDNFLAGEESNWHEHHVWINANSLHDRIKRLKAKNIIWFHGDVHAGDARIIENETFILTSKFGCKTDVSEQKRQANIILIDDEAISKISCNYEFPGHTQDVNLGDWILSQQKEIRRITPVTSTKSIENSEKLTPVNIEVEESILRKIKENELYQFGRFQVRDENTSLGWIDTSRLLNDKELLNRITDKSFDLIKDLGLKESDTIFLGIDILGGILASQLSVRFNVRNSIIPVRTKKDSYSEFEFSHSSSNDLTKVNNIIIFIDLISSGKTISDLIDEIKEKNKDINIHVISIISNDIDQKPIKIPYAKTYNTFCTKIKIPVIKNSDLPGKEFIPYN